MFRMETSILLSQGTRSTTSSPEDRTPAEPVVWDGFPVVGHGSSVVVGVDVGVVTVGFVVNASRTASRTAGIKTAVMTKTTTGATNIASFCSREMLAHCSRLLGSFICAPSEGHHALAAGQATQWPRTGWTLDLRDGAAAAGEPVLGSSNGRSEGAATCLPQRLRRAPPRARPGQRLLSGHPAQPTARRHRTRARQVLVSLPPRCCTRRSPSQTPGAVRPGDRPP